MSQIEPKNCEFVDERDCQGGKILSNLTRSFRYESYASKAAIYFIGYRKEGVIWMIRSEISELDRHVMAPFAFADWSTISMTLLIEKRNLSILT
jgi:hypothetical protein